MKKLLLAIMLIAAASTAANARCFVASHYGFEAGSRTASGQRLNLGLNTAAHRTLPFGTVLYLRHRNGPTTAITINDRGPFIKGRTLDVNSGAARRMGWSGTTTLCE